METIEKNKVEIQFKQIEVELMEAFVEALELKKTDTAELKMEAEQKNEELKKQLQAQTEMANKRLQQKLNRDKNPEMKDLLAREEMVNLANEDGSNKLKEERDKHDTLMNDRME